MKILIIVSALILCGCAQHSVTKQSLVQVWSSQRATEDMLLAVPAIDMCFGLNVTASREAFSVAAQKALKDMDSNLPAVINGSDINAYAIDYALKVFLHFNQDYGSHYSTAGLTRDKAKQCEKFHDENLFYIPKEIAKKM